MKTINNQIPASGTLANDYQEVLYWTITGNHGRVITMNILAASLFVIFGLIFSWLAFSLGKLPSNGEFTIISLSTIGLSLAGVLLTFGLQELLHGLTMKMFGEKLKSGIIWQGMLYAASPAYARRNTYVLVSLAPFGFLSILFVLGMWLLQGTLWVALLGICGIFNAVGAIGDMWIATIVLRYPAVAYVMDERDGMRVFLPKPRKTLQPVDGVQNREPITNPTTREGEESYVPNW